MAAALHKTPKGVVAYDKSVCVGCRYCQVACPYDVPKFQWYEALPVIVKCEMCDHREGGPACADVCPRGAIVKGLLADLKAEAHRRIAETPDRYLDKVYGEQEGGGTHVLYLTSPEVPFRKLGLPDLPTEPLPEMSEHVQHAIYKGFVAPGILYAAFTIVQFRNRRRDLKREAGHPDGKETP
jgi:ferredoxin